MQLLQYYDEPLLNPFFFATNVEPSYDVEMNQSKFDIYMAKSLMFSE